MHKSLCLYGRAGVRALHSSNALANPNWFQSFLIRNKILSLESVTHASDLFEWQKYRMIGSEELERIKIELDYVRTSLEKEKLHLREKRQESIDAKTKLSECRNTIKFYKENKGLAGGRGALVISKDDYIHAISEEMELEAVDEASYKELLMQQSKVEEAQDKFDSLQLQKYDENQKLERISQMRALVLLLLTPLVQFLMFRYLEPAKRQSQLKATEESLNKEISQLHDAIESLKTVLNENNKPPEVKAPIVMTSQGTMTDTQDTTEDKSSVESSANSIHDAKGIFDRAIGLVNGTLDANSLISGAMYCSCTVLWLLLKSN